MVCGQIQGGKIFRAPIQAVPSCPVTPRGSRLIAGYKPELGQPHRAAFIARATEQVSLTSFGDELVAIPGVLAKATGWADRPAVRRAATNDLCRDAD